MSSNDIAVSVRGLSKSYTIAHNAAKHTTLGEALAHRLKNPRQRVEKDTFWALKDVDFDIKKGDVVGIIGRNGAGKSTLLKILSQITEPTEGEINLYGRVGSLLEVGTGFHPELTGRENIFLNGAILGMRKSEIERQFDAIVEFAEVEKFLDTPVKRYSSGMYVRLAFAVAAHLNPEILIIDEVLAVGDAEFQKKCLGKMKDVSNSGRTVLFVSHNMSAISSLCSKAVLLKKGRISKHGSVELCIEKYISYDKENQGDVWIREKSIETSPLVIQKVSVSLEGNQPSHRLIVELEIHSLGNHQPAMMDVDIVDSYGVAIMQAQPRVSGFMNCETKNHQLRLTIDLPPMVPGQYSVTVWAGSHNVETLDRVVECVNFDIVQSPVSERTFPYTPLDHGYIVPFCKLDYFKQ